MVDNHGSSDHALGSAGMVPAHNSLDYSNLIYLPPMLALSPVGLRFSSKGIYPLAGYPRMPLPPQLAHWPLPGVPRATSPGAAQCEQGWRLLGSLASGATSMPAPAHHGHCPVPWQVGQSASLASVIGAAYATVGFVAGTSAPITNPRSRKRKLLSFSACCNIAVMPADSAGVMTPASTASSKVAGFSSE